MYSVPGMLMLSIEFLVLVQNAAVVAGDVLLCGSTIYFLLVRPHAAPPSILWLTIWHSLQKQSKDALPETVSILNRLMKVTFQVCMHTQISTFNPFSQLGSPSIN
jgi:hypothetical protein